MDYFSVFLNMFYLVAQSVMHILLQAALLEKRKNYGTFLAIFFSSAF